MVHDSTDRDIRHTVAAHYGARARQVLIGEPTISNEHEACCGSADQDKVSTDQLVQPLEVIESVSGEACCESDVCTAGNDDTGSQFGTALYTQEEIGELPDSVQMGSLGCGNPVAIADLNLGESVLDLGSGGGIDCFLAARQVGDDGEVWGLDMTPDMVQLARNNAEGLGVTNVRFRLGEIEDIPFESEKFHVLISNCVINLSTDKNQVFREAFRVLKPGGRLRISDVVLTEETAKKELRDDFHDWACCIDGAIPAKEYVDAIREAGFVEIELEYEGEGLKDNSASIASAYVLAFRPG